MSSEVEEIEAILRKYLWCSSVRTSPSVANVYVYGIPEAAAAIAALRSKDREDGAREMREDQEFAVAYTDARGRLDYEHMARVLSGRLRRMDRRSAAANRRADRLEAELAKHLEDHARLRASANEMWEQCKRYGGQMLANKRRAEEAEARVEALEAELATLPLSLAPTEVGDA